MSLSKLTVKEETPVKEETSVKEEVPEENKPELEYQQCCIGCGRDRGPMPPVAVEIAKVSESRISKMNIVILIDTNRGTNFSYEMIYFMNFSMCFKRTMWLEDGAPRRSLRYVIF